MKAEKLKNEEGIYLVMMSIGFVVILAMAAFILDGAKLYRARLHLQRSADAAVIAGMRYRIAIGKCTSNCGPTGDYSKAISDYAGHVALLNFDQQSKGFGLERELNYQDSLSGKGDTMFGQPTDLTLSGESNKPVFLYDGQPGTFDTIDSLSVRLESRVPTFLIHSVPLSIVELANFDDFNQVNVESRSRLEPVRISLLLDLSNSMRCGAGETDCPCLTDSTVPCPPYPSTKQKLLIDAVRNFVTGLRLGRDRVSIVPYNRVAQVAVSMSQDYTAPRNDAAYELAVNTAITSLDTGAVAIAETNQSDALARAFADMEAFYNQVHPPDMPSLAGGMLRNPAHFILFSDGAPTAARFLLPQNANAPSNITTFGDKDYNLYSTSWSSFNSGGTVAETTTAPSALMKSFRIFSGTSFPNAEVNFANNSTFPVDYFFTNGHPAITSGINPEEVYPNNCMQYNPGWNIRGTPEWIDRYTNFLTGAEYQQNPYNYPTPLTPRELNNELIDMDPAPPGVTAQVGDLFLEGFIYEPGDSFFQSLTKPQAHLPSNMYKGFRECAMISSAGDDVFQFHYPGQPTNLIGGIRYKHSTIDLVTADPDSLTNIWHEQLYNSAIVWTDFVRSRGNILHTIGLGSPADLPTQAEINADPGAVNPYQDVNNYHQRKDFFLSRLALAPSTLSPDDPNVSLGQGFSDEVLANLDIGLDQLDAFALRSQGSYSPTSNAAQLNSIFNLIKTRIQLKLTK